MWFASPDCADEILHVHFEPRVLSYVLADLAPERFDIPLLSVGDLLIAELSEHMASIIRSQWMPPALYIESLFNVMAGQIAKLQLAPLQAAKTGGLTERTIKRVQAYLMEHLDQDVSLTDLAALAGLSPHHFCRAFRQSTGSPPHTWLTARRMERAKELMVRHPETGLTEIAVCTGYSSQAAFGTAFKRTTGLTPSQWRRQRMP